MTKKLEELLNLPEMEDSANFEEVTAVRSKEDLIAEYELLSGEKAKPIYIEGISEQLNSDGSLNTEGNGGIINHYSRKALMTFAFLEILAQAKMQINSYEQRSHWGNESMPRRINRIIVTCPTAMSRVEQIALTNSQEVKYANKKIEYYKQRYEYDKNKLQKELEEVVKNDDNELIKSETLTYQKPLIIRLFNYISHKINNLRINRTRLYKRDNYECAYCGSKKQLTMDHIIPKSRKGKKMNYFQAISEISRITITKHL